MSKWWHGTGVGVPGLTLEMVPGPPACAGRRIGGAWTHDHSPPLPHHRSCHATPRPRRVRAPDRRRRRVLRQRPAPPHGERRGRQDRAAALDARRLRVVPRPPRRAAGLRLRRRRTPRARARPGDPRPPRQAAADQRGGCRRRRARCRDPPLRRHPGCRDRARWHDATGRRLHGCRDHRQPRVGSDDRRTRRRRRPHPRPGQQDRPPPRPARRPRVRRRHRHDRLRRHLRPAVPRRRPGRALAGRDRRHRPHPQAPRGRRDQPRRPPVTRRDLS